MRVCYLGCLSTRKLLVLNDYARNRLRGRRPVTPRRNGTDRWQVYDMARPNELGRSVPVS